MVDDDAAYVTEVEAFRRAKDVFFGEDPSSPLTGDQRASFAGLAYFAVDPRLRFEGPIIWVCPLPPPENHLTMPVRAGERSFPDARH